MRSNASTRKRCCTRQSRTDSAQEKSSLFIGSNHNGGLMSEPQSLIVYEKRDPHIAVIRLNRPEKKNSISRDLYWALDGAWHEAKDDDDVWSIILTGTADAFCVGGDLKENLA